MMWKQVNGYEGIYEVSNEGVIRTVYGRILKQWLNSSGYALVRVSNPRAVLRVHRVVADAFVKNEFNLPFVNHLDCIRHNNNCNNLQWCTQKQNIQYADSLGRMKRDFWTGKRSPNAKLTDDIVNKIIESRMKNDISYKCLADKFGTNKKTIGMIINKKSYLPLPEPPK